MGDFKYARDGQQSYNEIIKAATEGGFVPPLQVTSTTGGSHAGGSWHYTGNAVDFSNGTDTDEEARFAQWIMNNFGPGTGELIHSGGKGYYIADGKEVPASYYSSVLPAHHNHVHWAITLNGLKDAGQIVPGNSTPSNDFGGLLGPLKSLVDFASEIVKLFKFFVNPHNWFRIAEFLLGAGLLYLGLKGLDISAVNSVSQSASQFGKKVKSNVKKAGKKTGQVVNPPKSYKPAANENTTGVGRKFGEVRDSTGKLGNGDAIPKVTKSAEVAIKDTVG